jgi:hypothetical protein
VIGFYSDLTYLSASKRVYTTGSSGVFMHVQTSEFGRRHSFSGLRSFSL